MQTPGSPPRESRHADQPIGASEADVITLDGAWTAIDVYVDAHGQAAAVGATVKVYGSSEGVPSGLLFSGVVTAPPPRTSGVRVVHGVGGRVPQKYRVTVTPGSGGPTGQVRFVAVGYGTEPS